jgi:hypothetical protein
MSDHTNRHTSSPGHRAIWKTPEEITAVVTDFLKRKG